MPNESVLKKESGIASNDQSIRIGSIGKRTLLDMTCQCLCKSPFAHPSKRPYPAGELACRGHIGYDRSTAMNVLANTDAYSTGSGLLAEHLSPANVVTIPLADKDPVRLGWIYPQNAKLSSHAEEFVRLLEQSIQRSIAYTSSLHRQIVGK